MRLVIFGLSVSSSWGNGHATLWRGMIRALVRRGHETVFYERDVPYYAEHRDLTALDGLRLELYSDWDEARRRAEADLRSADAGIVTSYCADGAAACELVRASRASVRIFYDLDTPVTLQRLSRGEQVPYLPRDGLRGFDLVLSYTGGDALRQLRTRLGAERVAPLYGHVDPDQHRPVRAQRRFRADLSYLGTYAADRQPALEELLLRPARQLRSKRFLVAGALYPDGFPAEQNVRWLPHLTPGLHAAFFSSSALTLNITRRAMAEAGWCPSGRLFEAAACGTPILSDWWKGLDNFYAPGREILIARSAADTVAALGIGAGELRQIARAARERTLDEHTAAHRAAEFERLLEQARRPAARTAA
jgi:spore maturation protein CgeB